MTLSLIPKTGTSVAENRRHFDEMEQILLQYPQIDADGFQLVERVSGGLYLREITIPRGCLLTGRVYKFDHMEMMVRGDITIYSATEGKRTRYTDHTVIEAQAGKRQAGFAHEETVWVTVNKVPDIAIEKMQAYTTTRTFAEYDAFHRALNRYDFAGFLRECNLSLDEMNALVESEGYQPLPDGYEHIQVRPSDLSGNGLFTSTKILKGEMICPVKDGPQRTVAGRFSNHALHANSRSGVEAGQYYVYACRDIQAGEEITMNYREILNFRGKICLDG